MAAFMDRTEVNLLNGGGGWESVYTKRGRMVPLLRVFIGCGRCIIRQQGVENE